MEELGIFLGRLALIGEGGVIAELVMMIMQHNPEASQGRVMGQVVCEQGNRLKTCALIPALLLLSSFRVYVEDIGDTVYTHTV